MINMNSDRTFTDGQSSLGRVHATKVEHMTRWKSWVKWHEAGEGQAWVLLTTRALPSPSPWHWWGMAAQLLLPLSASLVRAGVISMSWPLGNSFQRGLNDSPGSPWVPKCQTICWLQLHLVFWEVSPSPSSLTISQIPNKNNLACLI